MASGSVWLRRILGRDESLDALLLSARRSEKEGRLFEARELYARVLAREAGHVEALKRLGRIADAERKPDEAISLFSRAVSLAPADLDAHHCLGVACSNAGRHAQAEDAFRAGLAHGEDTHLLIGLAAALLKLKRFDEARSRLERALEIDPSSGEAYFGLSSIALEDGRIQDAIASFLEAHARMPGKAAIHSGLLFVMNYSPAFSATELFAAHKLFGERQTVPVAPPAPDRAWPRRLRIGYISPDFRSHVVSCFILPIIAHHDRQHFDVFCYYLHKDNDNVTAGLLELADHWRSCAGLSDAEVAARIRDDRIDILVDLAGHTADNAMLVLAMRPAPVQATYLGYPNTTGLRAVSHRITDAKADPPGAADRLHTERLVRLPKTFLCYRPGPGLSEGGLPALSAGAVTFGSFNNVLKWSDPFLVLAARVLQEVPGSRLLLKERTLSFPAKADALRRKFANLGVDPSRLILKAWEATPEGHMKTYTAVDIALDSFPYNGTTTTCEALWMGVPVVTLAGDRHAGRVGVSLLETVGLDRLIAHSEEEYVRIAAQLASDLPGLAALRAGMRERMRGSALMDEGGFVRSLEQAYIALWEERLREPEPGDLDDAALTAFCREAGARGDHAEVIGRLGEVIARHGESALRRYLLGCAFEDAGRWTEAAASYEAALRLDPCHAKAANNLGVVLHVSGNPKEAERLYGEALRLDPALAIAHGNRGKLRMLDGRFAEAAVDLRRAVELRPDAADWQEALRECAEAARKAAAGNRS